MSAIGELGRGIAGLCPGAGTALETELSMMNVGARRWLAFAGGCAVGVGLGGLTSGAVSDLNYYLSITTNIQIATGPGTMGPPAAPTMWIACLIIGMGLGTALAAMIPANRELGRRRIEQPDHAAV